ncbi:hypothetical protein GIB67_023179 [Kingdonia uniflora]|uniref:DUF4218 domain-containing protein n=1 Tax=Kingdonia uniflora TaxID=39325 RepID=A0A7J7MC65_9MAGN|nr:hypothetical protein GIB67_023179 [Kingdonia uniflora]
MMKWCKKYVTNKAYPEGCIAQKYLDEEAMMYCKEYMNDGAKGNYTRGLSTFGDYDDECAKPLDKKGKEYFLNTVKYEQAYKWVLRQAAENFEWVEKYNTFKENLNSRSQKTTSEKISPLVGDWRDLEEEDKEYIRKVVVETFDLDPDEHQVMLDYKANMVLKKWKSRLRKNNYDAYETDEEKKSKRPKGVKKEDWIEFVDRLSTPEEQAKREKGKTTKSKMHIPHTTGQLGASGKKEILEKGRSKDFVKRYEIFMACHTKEDVTYPEEMKERMIYELENFTIRIFKDGNGHVRGYNGHLNKTNLRVSAPFRRVIEWERVKKAMLNEVQESLEVEANECRQLEKRVAAFESRESPCGAYMHRPFENTVSTSQALWALKGLVKLQAFVRGNIMRKKTTDTMRAIQVLVRVQARARARASSGSIMETRRHSNKPSMSHPGPPIPEKYERTRCSNNTSHNRFSNLKRSAVKQNSCDNFDFGKAHLGWHHLECRMEKYSETPIRSTPTNDEKREKILEIDTGKPLFNSTGRRGLHSSYNALSLDRNSQSLTSIDSPSRDYTIAQ